MRKVKKFRIPPWVADLFRCKGGRLSERGGGCSSSCGKNNLTGFRRFSEWWCVNTLLRILSTVPLLALHAVAQGPLSPPGAPAPAMKSLDQIEPRIAVQKLAAAPPYTISQPGSYYLTGNIEVTSQNAITIMAPGVTLDLGGFTISSSLGSASVSDAVVIKNGSHSCRIQNGSIRSGSVVSGSGIFVAGFNGGIVLESPNSNTIYNVSVDNVSIHGVGGIGINLGYDGMVTGCRLYHCGIGITCGSAASCMAEYIASNAINCTKSVSNSKGNSRLGGIGISAGTVSNSSGSANGMPGIFATTVTGSSGSSDSGAGIQATTVSHSSGSSTSGYGIACTTAINSTGTSDYGTGMDAQTASHCKGTGGSYGMVLVSGDNCSGYSNGYLPGIQGENLTNSRGISQGTGIRAVANATNCYGKSLNGGSPPGGVSRIGIWVDGTASFCRGDHSSSAGVAIQAGIAVACTSANGSISSSSKQLGTP